MPFWSAKSVVRIITKLSLTSVIENLGLRRAKPFNSRYAGLHSNLVHVFSSRFLVKRSQARSWWFRFTFRCEGELDDVIRAIELTNGDVIINKVED